MAERGERETSGGAPSHGSRVKLAELGVSEKKSSRFQQAAAEPEEISEDELIAELAALLEEAEGGQAGKAAGMM
jgi:hypothetical protein